MRWKTATGWPVASPASSALTSVTSSHWTNPFAIGSSAFVWRYGKPQFVLVWLLSFYVLIGLVETIRAIPERFRRRREEEAETSLEQG